MSVPSFTWKDIQLTVMDFIAGGIFSMTQTLTFFIHQVAIRPNVQVTILNALQEQQENESGRLSSHPYIKACLKETFRLSPSVPGIMRIVPEDTVLCDYHIPAGTAVFANSMIACRSEFEMAFAVPIMKQSFALYGSSSSGSSGRSSTSSSPVGSPPKVAVHTSPARRPPLVRSTSARVAHTSEVKIQSQKEMFSRPLEFLPERWLQDRPRQPFAVLPFGFGARMCVGRHFAELEMCSAVAACVSKFQLSSPLSQIPLKYIFIIAPDGPVPIEMRSRHTLEVNKKQVATL
ncbi:ecdysone 20-monooxygenase-like [Tropilaelaps mercedesae]|uniref:Ecdysone 20-monooxygenase-like n=1 Tax=Tropilaelaps mercedesae TaxID=418985 RepID=A0A1V9XBY7_9ACAR|nr:ecdysone 20-monooxygenase-like [Tropilaelaps mercedesae]